MDLRGLLDPQILSFTMQKVGRKMLSRGLLGSHLGSNKSMLLNNE